MTRRLMRVYKTTEKQRRTSSERYWTHKAIQLSLEKRNQEMEVKALNRHYQLIEKAHALSQAEINS